jgi:hypothetical protein
MLGSPRPAHACTSRLSPHTRPPLVLADLLVSYLNRYGKHPLRTRVHALHIVTYILITRDRALFGSVLHAFALIDTVYRDPTGLLVHLLRALLTP